MSQIMDLILKFSMLAVLIRIGREDRRCGRIPHELTDLLTAAAAADRLVLMTCGAGGKFRCLSPELPDILFPVAGTTRSGLLYGAVDGLGGACVGVGLLLCAVWLRKGRGLGGGDVRLVGAGGLLLGTEGVLPMLLAACLAAVPEACMTRFRGERFFPFGPYLCAAIAGTMILTAVPGGGI